MSCRWAQRPAGRYLGSCLPAGVCNWGSGIACNLDASASLASSTAGLPYSRCGLLRLPFEMKRLELLAAASGAVLLQLAVVLSSSDIGTHLLPCRS